MVCSTIDNADPDLPHTGIAGAMTRICRCIDELFEYCPPSTYPLMPLCRLAVRLLTVRPPDTVPKLAVALKYLQIAIQGAETIYSPHHPTIAILAAQKARLLAMEMGGDELNRLRHALMAYREGIRRCDNCFGPGGGLVGWQLRAEMAILEQEVSALAQRT